MKVYAAFILLGCTMLSACAVVYRDPLVVSDPTHYGIFENPHEGDGFVTIDQINGISVLNEDYYRFELPPGPVVVEVVGVIKKGQELVNRRLVFTVQEGHTYIFRYKTIRPGSNDTWKTLPSSWKAWIEDKSTGNPVLIENISPAPKKPNQISDVKQQMEK